MTTASKPSAAKAETAAETDAADEPRKVEFEVELNGTTVKLSVLADLMDAPFEVMEAYEDGRHGKAFMALIGPVQAQKLRKAGMTPRQFKDVVTPAYEEATDVGEG